ncbi:MAG: hypothetical protein KDC98_24300, partial [Planctomycetes bacterium]|nr:hypothetical protein [Planctomycetota bacterium]
QSTHLASLFALSVTVALSSGAATAQRLIAIDATPAGATAYELDRATATPTALGPASPAAAVPGDLAYDYVTGRLFMSGAATDSLYLVDVTNWQATLIGPYGNAAILMHGIEWDSSTGTLYGMSTHDSGLYTIDTTTGAATLVGVTGLAAATSWGLSLGYDLVNDVMYLTSTNTDSLYTIDRTTGLATLVGPMNGVYSIASLAYDYGSLQMYAIDNIYDQLFTVDLGTGTTTLTGSVGTSNMLSLVYLPEAGRMSRLPHACGPTTITPTGAPTPGHTVDFALGGVVGLPFVGFGLSGTTQTFCTCTLGHSWQAAAPGATVSFVIPPGTWIVGVSVFAQGADLLGNGGCASPQFTLTDTIRVTIG